MADITNRANAAVDLASRWAADRCPMIDGLVFGDGRVKQVRATWKTADDGRVRMVLEPGGWTTLHELRANGPLDWTGIINLCQAENPVLGVRILGGEGGHGSDGFVAALRIDSGEIVWIAFFTASNPFEVVQIQGDIVLARSNLGIWWRFPIATPEEVSLDSCSPFG